MTASMAYSQGDVNAILDIAPASSSVAPALAIGLRRVEQRFREQLETPIAPMAELCAHVERYRGKMLRPTLTLLSGLAVEPAIVETGFPEAHITVAAVVEMIHMATLVHDDVLDEADVRRGGDTVNKRRGNESAVILGDYLISKAFHLCSTLESQATAMRVGEITSVVCEGEMMQVGAAGRMDLSEREYFQIIERKTAALIAVACELGARHASGLECSDDAARRMFDFGLRLGSAFQIQDDLLDLLGAAQVVGKPVGRDLEKGKLTLPAIHHLAHVDPARRGESERLFRDGAITPKGRAAIGRALERTGSVEYARAAAAGLVGEARTLLTGLPETGARSSLEALAGAVISRTF